MARTFEVDAVVDLISEGCQSRGFELWTLQNGGTLENVEYPFGVRPWATIKPEIEQVFATYIQETINPPAE